VKLKRMLEGCAEEAVDGEEKIPYKAGEQPCFILNVEARSITPIQ
jgi:hypothetical protein